MFQDDRMISILSAVVLMVAIGTVIQRADIFQNFSGGTDTVVLNPDPVEAQVNRLLRVDVFRNDVGLTDEDHQRLTVLREPECGRVFLQGSVLQYLPDSDCVGSQVIQYGIHGRDGVVGEVVAQMYSSDGLPLGVPVPGAPMSVAPVSEEEAEATRTLARASGQRTTEQVTEDQQAMAEQPGAAGTESEITETAQTELARVVDTLTQGAATAAQAGTAPDARVETETAPDATRVSQASGNKEKPAVAALAEPVESASGLAPALEQPVIAALDTPGASPRVAEVPAGSEAPGGLSRAAPGLEVPAGAAPDPVRIIKPGGAASIANVERQDPGEQRPVSATDNIALAGAGVADANPVAGIAPELDGGFLVALVERREPNTLPPAAPLMSEAGDLSPSGASAASLPNVAGAESQVALLDPLAEIAPPGAVRGTSLRASPVDPAQLPLDPNPVRTSNIPPLKPSGLPRRTTRKPIATGAESTAPAAVDGAREAPEVLTEPPADQIAALPRHDAPCVLPPAMTIDVRRAARSIVSVDAPCHADTVAELKFSGLSLAVPLDRQGKGSVTALGFEPNAPALLSFVNGETIDFDLPFKGIARVSRVAVIWEMPVSLELNAVEFGGELDGLDHVHPDNPRQFEDVRRSGGGFLETYRSHAGVGQNAQVYTFWHRRGGRQGVVEMMIDYASRNRDRLDGTCGDGKYAAPNFLIMRSINGRLDRPVIRKLAALDCSRVAEERGGKRLISGAVSDLVVTER